MWLRFEKEKCTGCGACVVACMDEYGRPVRGRFCRLYEREFFDDGRLRVDFYITGCQHCEDAPCIQACPQRCFSRDRETGFVLLDAFACQRCGRCVQACRFGVVTQGQGEKAAKCNGCAERVRRGTLPRCVEVCRVGAIRPEHADGNAHEVYLKNLHRELSAFMEKERKR
ncbi:MAG: 4Fe-4S binding protein [Synergistaceae bacterium]|nr:4Fe-4S binding protein [Synergistaceae bacterium]